MRLLKVLPGFLPNLLIALFAWAFFCTPPAHAYLDPGTGSFIFHLVIGTMLGAMMTIRLWWSRLVSLIKPKSKS